MNNLISQYREPGVGAVDFAKQYVKGMAKSVALLQIKLLLEGRLHDHTDKRVKRCDYCGHWWRDDSLRNTKRTCGDACKTNLKTLQRRQQRADKELLNPTPNQKKRTLMDDYVYWLEYPYWTDEYSMLKIAWKYEVPHDIETMDTVISNAQTYGEGNSKKKCERVDF